MTREQAFTEFVTGAHGQIIQFGLKAFKENGRGAVTTTVPDIPAGSWDHRLVSCGSRRIVYRREDLDAWQRQHLEVVGAAGNGL